MISLPWAWANQGNMAAPIGTLMKFADPFYSNNSQFLTWKQQERQSAKKLIFKCDLLLKINFIPISNFSFHRFPKKNKTWAVNWICLKLCISYFDFFISFIAHSILVIFSHPPKWKIFALISSKVKNKLRILVSFWTKTWWAYCLPNNWDWILNLQWKWQNK